MRDTRLVNRHPSRRSVARFGARAIESLEERLLLTAYHVNSAADTLTGVGTTGTLRYVLTQLDQTGEATNSIDFSIGALGAPATITLGSDLPAVTRTVSIDATTQASYIGIPLVEIKGASNLSSGLHLAPGSDGSTVRGLAIYGFGVAGEGILVESPGDAIQANYLGTDSTGKAAGVGNGIGLEIHNVANTLVGGLSGLGNTISGNAASGILIQGDNAINTRLLGNLIGTDSSGSGPLGNGGPGVLITRTTLGASNTTIGGTAPGAANTIAYNTPGVQIDRSTANPLVQNRVYGSGNNAPGISLNNGGNANQAAPTLDSVLVNAGTTTVTGRLDTGFAPSTTYTVEFFASAAGDPPTGDQAHVFLGSLAVTTGATGQASFSPQFPVGLLVGQRVTATATSPARNTSPFALAKSGSVINPFVVTTAADSGPGSLRQAIADANTNPGLDTILFSIPGPGPYTITLTSAQPVDLTDPVVIEGLSQPGSSAANLVQIVGGGLDQNGLTLAAGSGGSTIEGLGISGFGQAGVQILSSGNAIRNDTITGNALGGVTVSGGTGNTLSQNRIFQNAAAGIILTNGGNNLQVGPVVSAVNSVPGLTTVAWSFTPTQPGTYTFEFFAGDPTGVPGQAQVFLGQLTQNFASTATVAGTFTSAVPAGPSQVVTATATRAATGDTSAFGHAAAPSAPYVVTTAADGGIGSLRQAILNANASPGLDTITFTTASLGPLTQALPTITDPLVLDATSVPGLTLTRNASIANGLVLGPYAGSPAQGSTIKGLTITGFAQNGVLIQSSANLVQDSTLSANSGAGILVVSGIGNDLRRNNLFRNGPAPSFASAFNDLQLSSGANNNPPIPLLTGVQIDPPSHTLTLGLSVTFAASVTDPASVLTGATLDVFANTPSTNPQDRPVVASVGLTAGEIAIDPKDPATANIAVVIPGLPPTVSLASNLFATITYLHTNPAGEPSGTSPYSNASQAADPFTVVSTQNDGVGSLRKVIENINEQTAACVRIAFQLPSESHIIHVTSALPPIQKLVVIDGTTEPGFDPANPATIVEISGLNAGAEVPGNGLTFVKGSEGSVVQGLSIFGFQGAGILAEGLVKPASMPSITIAGVYSGIDPAGTNFNAGNGTGILLHQTTGAVIGLDTLSSYDANCNATSLPGSNGRNIVSANMGNGITIEGGGSNLVHNSIVGAGFLNVIDPTKSSGNLGDGILIDSSPGNTIGTVDPTQTIPGRFNVVSGNRAQVDPQGRTSGGNGVHVTGPGSTGNQINASMIGTDSTGQLALGNDAAGVRIDGGAASNVLGALFGSPGTSSPVLLGNLISGNKQSGIMLSGVSSNSVVGNRIGTTLDGSALLGNVQDGITLKNATATTIGDSILGAGNLVAGNLQNGIGLTDSFGNTIGPATTTTTPVDQALLTGGNTITQNGADGILISYTTSAKSPTPNAIHENVVARNSKEGIHVSGVNPGYSHQALDTIGHNFIGTDSTGDAVYVIPAHSTVAVTQGNGINGVLLEGVPALVQNNAIAGNGLNGIQVNGGAAGNVTGTQIDGNRIGVDRSTGTRPVDILSNGQSLPRGNVLDGVLLGNVVGVAVGTASPNVISGNLGRGIEVRGFPSAGPTGSNQIANNVIGLDATGQKAVFIGPGTLPVNVGNLSDGIFLLDAPATTITSNTVSNNRGFGIHAVIDNNSATQGLSVVSNRIGTNIDGSTTTDPQAQKPNVESLGNSADGVFLDRLVTTLAAGASLVSMDSNTISGNRSNGIDVLNSTGIAIVRNHIGTNAQGTAKLGNAGNGIFLNESSGNLVGGDPTAANVISGNQASGILISAAQSTVTPPPQATDNTIFGNLIGTDATGLAGIPNAVSGIVINNADGNQVGDGTVDHRNLISGNALYGILLATGASGNQIDGNLIGTDIHGNLATYLDTTDPTHPVQRPLGNTSDGVFLIDSPGNFLGLARANVISGNQGNGVHVFGKASVNNGIVGNTIGLSRSGDQVAPNAANGVYLDSVGPGNRVGPGNVISGNAQAGVVLFSVDGSGSTSVYGDLIGTNAAGNAARPNGSFGVFVSGSSDNTIGGDNVERKGNTISGNALSGLVIFSPTGRGGTATSERNLVFGNNLGTDVSGSAAIANLSDGVEILDSSNNIVGSPGSPPPTSAMRGSWNLVSGNAQNGILVNVSPDRLGGGQGNVLDGNLIGTDSTGRNVLARGAPQKSGILVNNARGTFLGGLGGALIPGTNVPAQPHNVIVAASDAGIQFTGLAQANSVWGNYLGVDTTGRGGPTLGNGSGVFVNNLSTQSSGEAIGGTQTGAGNIIGGGATLGNTDRTTISLAGVYLSGPVAAAAGGQSTLAGNLIGLDAAGNLAGSQVGVLIVNSGHNAIGAPGDSGGNVISGNLDAGIRIANASSSGNVIANNRVGTNIAGTALPAQVPPNGSDTSRFQTVGIGIDNAFNNVIGLSGTAANRFTSYRAVTAANLVGGNVIGGNVDGVLISGFDPAGKAGNRVVGNRVGTSSDGLSPVPNLQTGVVISNSTHNVVRGNLLAANGISGAEIFGEKSVSNDISSNLAGPDLGGNAAFVTPRVALAHIPTRITGYLVFLNAQRNGIAIVGSSNNQVGRTGANLMKGNLDVGMYLTQIDFTGKHFAEPTNNTIARNQVLQNGIYGVLQYNAPNNIIVRAGTNRNTVSGNQINFLNFVTGVNTQAPTPPLTSSFTPKATQAHGAGAAVPKGPAVRRSVRVKARGR